MRPLRRLAAGAALAALGAASSSPVAAQANGDASGIRTGGPTSLPIVKPGAQLDQARVGAPAPALLRRDAPIAPAGPNPPFDPLDPSTALAFDFTQGGVNFNGIGQLITPVGGGFAAFCTTQRIAPTVLLAAAHCVTDDNTGALLPGATPGGGATARFLGPGSTASVRDFHTFDVASITVRPDWTGFNTVDFLWKDIAIVTFASALPSWITTYPLFLGDPLLQPSLHVGYGTFGTGTGQTNFDSRRRWGTNDVEWIPSLPGFYGNDMYLIDFDDGTPVFDTFCLVGLACNQGLSTEAGISPGDSGGPLFVNGALAGVASFGSYFCAVGPGCPPYVADVARPFDSFGSFMGYAPIAPNAAFINAALVPEPSTIVLTGGGLALLLGAARRRRR